LWERGMPRWKRTHPKESVGSHFPPIIIPRCCYSYSILSIGSIIWVLFLPSIFLFEFYFCCLFFSLYIMHDTLFDFYCSSTIVIGLKTIHFLLYNSKPSYIKGIFLIIASKSTK
jgi:hypothetical protein